MIRIDPYSKIVFATTETIQEIYSRMKELWVADDQLVCFQFPWKWVPSSNSDDLENLVIGGSKCILTDDWSVIQTRDHRLLVRSPSRVKFEIESNLTEKQETSRNRNEAS